MALVYRNGQPYLYESFRRNGKVTSRYWGSGDWVIAASQLDAHDREERDFERRRATEQRRELEMLGKQLDQLVQDAIGCSRQLLEAAGYHQHKRGEWRKQRVRTSKPNPVPNPSNETQFSGTH